MAYDVLLDSDGDLPEVTRHSNTRSVVAQRVYFRLRTFRGEWVLDNRKGLPLLEWRSVKNPDAVMIASQISNEIRTTPGVGRLADVATQFDSKASKLSYSASVYTEENELLLLALGLSEREHNQSISLSISGPDGNVLR